MPIAPGGLAPRVAGVEFARGPTALVFYKVTCPVCQMAAPKVDVLARAFPGRVQGIGQDDPSKLARFARDHGMDAAVQPDLPPYPLSDAYGVRVVPTLFLVGTDGTVLHLVESWDRDGYNEAARHLADLTSREFVPVSEPGDGLPPFRPG